MSLFEFTQAVFGQQERLLKMTVCHEVDVESIQQEAVQLLVPH